MTQLEIMLDTYSDLYEQANGMKLVVDPQLTEQILGCGKGIHTQVSVDISTGELWGAVCLDGEWKEYHDDDIINIGAYSYADARALMGDDWDGEESDLRETLLHYLIQSARLMVFCTLVAQREQSCEDVVVWEMERGYFSPFISLDE